MLSRCWGLLLALIVLAPLQAQDTPAVPKGVEVLARGPVHEAYASPTTEPAPTKPIGKQPPAPIEEVPPDEKPEGDVVWISGYWAYDEERDDFLWVSGIWRVVPPGRQWVAGYWREENGQWQWIPGFWTAVKKEADKQEITYLPAPPAAPEVAPPGKPPSEDSFFVPGVWIWTGDRYVFRAGYWARVQPGYVWVPDHYRWTPLGYVYVPGYWDLALKRRGILYAPVVIDPVVRVGFVYTPAYAVRDTVVIESLFVRPAVCHYYFGDYYAPSYRHLGYESCFIYSRRRYDSIIVYETYERRDPTWISFQINLFNDRCAGRVPRPPRTLIQQNTVVNNTVINNNTTIVNNHTTSVNNNTLVAPTKQVAVTKNTNLVKLDEATRQKARAQAASVQQVGQQRANTEVTLKPGTPRAPRTAALAVPKTEPVKPEMSVPAVRPTPPPDATAARHTPPVGRANERNSLSATASAKANGPNSAHPARSDGPSPTAPARPNGPNGPVVAGRTKPSNNPASTGRMVGQPVASASSEAKATNPTSQPVTLARPMPASGTKPSQVNTVNATPGAKPSPPPVTRPAQDKAVQPAARWLPAVPTNGKPGQSPAQPPTAPVRPGATPTRPGVPAARPGIAQPNPNAPKHAPPPTRRPPPPKEEKEKPKL